MVSLHHPPHGALATTDRQLSHTQVSCLHTPVCAELTELRVACVYGALDVGWPCAGESPTAAGSQCSGRTGGFKLGLKQKMSAFAARSWFAPTAPLVENRGDVQ
jgi:hypothetical protein